VMKDSIVSPARPSRWLMLLLCTAVLVMAAVGYGWTGSPRTPSAAASAQGAGAPAPAAPTDDAAREFAAAAEELAQHLKGQADNAEGWATLARAYLRLGRVNDALPAFAKAVALQDKDARLLADYAEALAASHPNGLRGEPSRLIEAALQLDPSDEKVLLVAGKAAFQRKDFADAVRLWERLHQMLPVDSTFAAPLQSAIDQARAQGRRQGAPQAASGPAVRGRVRLSPTIAAQAAPDDTVFIVARAVTGPRMPLAVLRRHVKDLPFDFRLDDSTAMSPATRLSLHPRVVISARISKSGQATPSAGDLTGQSAAVTNDANGLVIEIDQVVRN
jgi:cytochrome c-type biogenesis protein CcmH